MYSIEKALKLNEFERKKGYKPTHLGHKFIQCKGEINAGRFAIINSISPSAATPFTTGTWTINFLNGYESIRTASRCE